MPLDTAYSHSLPTQGLLLVDLVIDLIDDDQTLKSISLAGRACRPRCKAKLFRKITISMSDLDQALHRFDSEVFNIFGCVRQLTIGHQPRNPQASPADFYNDPPLDKEPFDLNWHIPPESLQRLSAFLPKLTAVHTLNLVDGHWDVMWAILPASSVDHFFSSVSKLHTDCLVFPGLGQYATFLLRFQRLKGLVLGDNNWAGIKNWEAQYQGSSDVQRMRVDPPVLPLTSLETLEVWWPTGFGILERIFSPPGRDSDLCIRSLVLGCDTSRDFEEMQNILNRTRDHLQDLEIRLLDDEAALKGDKALDLSHLGELRSFSCRMNPFIHYDDDDDDVHQYTLLDLVSTLPDGCEELRILDIMVERTSSPHNYLYLQQLGLGSLDHILHEPGHRNVRRLAFTAKLTSYLKSDHDRKLRVMMTIRARVLKFMQDCLPKTSSRGVEFVVTVDDSEAVQLPF